MRGHVVVIDDEDTIEVYIARLARDGFEVHHKKTWTDGLDAIRAIGSDLIAVVLDVMMPPGTLGGSGIGTGVEVYKLIREENRTVPVLVLTLRNDINMRHFGKDDKRMVVLRKLKCSPAQLLEHVHHFYGVDSLGDAEL